VPPAPPPVAPEGQLGLLDAGVGLLHPLGVVGGAAMAGTDRAMIVTPIVAPAMLARARAGLQLLCRT